MGRVMIEGHGGRAFVWECWGADPPKYWLYKVHVGQEITIMVSNKVKNLGKSVKVWNHDDGSSGSVSVS